jgi:hypothetical protein
MSRKQELVGCKSIWSIFKKYLHYNMLEPTLDYYATSLPCKLRYLSHCGTSFFVCLHWKILLPSLSLCHAHPLLLGHSSDSGWWKHCWHGETSDYHLMQDGNHTQDARKFPTWSVGVKHVYRQASHALSCLRWTTDTISSHSLCSLHVHHTFQHACEFWPG